MNGLNKQRSRFIFFAVVAVYIVLIILLNVFLLNIPGIYQSTAEDRAATVKTDILAVLQGSNPDKSVAFDALREEYKFELVVLSGDTTIYSTMPIDDFNKLDGIIDSEALNYQERDSYVFNGTDYQVWMAIYKYSSQSFFELILYIVIGSVVILSGLIIVLIFVMFRSLISPLQRLRDNIFKLKEYRLSEVAAGNAESEYDSISEELSHFSADLEGKITTFGVQYSQLERELKSKHEQYKDKINLVRALIHDIKSPLSIEQMQIDQLKIDLRDDEQQLHRVELLQKSVDKIMNEMVDVLKILDINATQMTKQEVDLVATSKELLRIFLPVFQEQGVTYELIAPPKMIIKINAIELKQIIHNILSNAAQYTKPGGIFELDLYEDNGQVHITAYNDVADTKAIDFERVFDLFYYANNQDNYSTGIGMFTIKNMVEANGGTCSFAEYQDGVRLHITLPLVVEGIA
ncbi:sensor histidine kinase [Culicoidibacter larvae]|uniref:histidine kinase n=1 Tax=Culicoidibacter larvae TaxID=2579976 RepID=A0A5R8Q8A7_9FIRM|nr:HAMP domain-containing sensor histidine kinase [Culicoidibacter larvae]TLG71817.1 HAMP domain-containing histidine kinase [Culicoidibacter larvae]